MKWLLCGTLFLSISTSLGCFFRLSFRKKNTSKWNKHTNKQKRIRKVASNLHYMRFTYYTEDNQQACFRLSNWFSLWCLGSWMNYLSPVWWTNFRFRFLIVSWCGNLCGGDSFLGCIHVLCISKVCLLFSSQINLLSNSFVYLILCTDIFHRRRLYFFFTN